MPCASAGDGSAKGSGKRIAQGFRKDFPEGFSCRIFLKDFCSGIRFLKDFLVEFERIFL